MAVDLKIKSNSKQVSKKFKKFQSVLPRIIDKGIKQAGFQLIDIIRTKTKKGINFKDGAFAPYSQGYLKKLNREGKSTNVDLFYSGRMLGSLTPNSSVKKTGKHKVSLGFNLYWLCNLFNLFKYTFFFLLKSCTLGTVKN